MGRILYSLLEHSFYQREGDENGVVVSEFNPRWLPKRLLSCRLSSNAECNKVVDEIALDLMESDLATRRQVVGGLGPSLCSSDELGVPFAITVDFQTLADGAVTCEA
jgi:glycyl-tRNA synthetase